MKNIYSVSQVNRYIKSLLSEDYFLSRIYVRGEVSNCKYHSSGHIYFTLKDRTGAIPCVMFAGNRGGLNFRMQEGQQVIVLGGINVYERDGRYQLYAKQIIRDGKGDLNQQFEQLKEMLAVKGYFDASHKKTIPPYPEKIGIVTAPTGAAIQDMINIASRRNPYVQLYLYPALVQGECAAASIAAGIRYLDRFGVDIIIIGRGGGSMEDLWAFNEEIVADALYRCKTPVISAVGHETDVTISDFVADLRAPTPSAAAELAIPLRREIENMILNDKKRLMDRMTNVLERYRLITEQYRIRIEHLSPVSKINDERERLMAIEDTMRRLLTSKLTDYRYQLAIYSEKLGALSPLNQLTRGYAYVTDAQGSTVTSAGSLAANDLIHIRLTDGEADAKITAVREDRDNGESKEH